MDSGLIFPHHRNLNTEDSVKEKTRRMKVAGAQADGAGQPNPESLNWRSRKVCAYAKVPVPQTDTGG